MQQIKSYNCFLTEKGYIVVAIPFIDVNAPKQAELLYAGGEHALFSKTPEQTVILDYLNEIVRPVLGEANRILLFEVDLAVQAIVRDYFVPVKHVDLLPEFSLERSAA